MLRPYVIVVGAAGSGKSHLCSLVAEASHGKISTEEFPSMSRSAHGISLRKLRRHVRARRACTAGLAVGTGSLSQAMVSGAACIAWYVASGRWEEADDDTMRLLLRECDAVVIVIARADLLLDDIDHSSNTIDNIIDGYKDEEKGGTSDEALTSAAHNITQVVKSRFPQVPLVWCGDPRLSSSPTLWLPPTCHGLHGGHSNRFFRVNRRLCQWTCVFADETSTSICGRSHTGPWPPFGMHELTAHTEAVARAVCEQKATWFSRSRLRSALFAWFDKGISQRGVKLFLVVIGLGSLIAVVQPNILAKILQPHFGQEKLVHSPTL